MNNNRRNFLDFLGLSYLSIILLPYNLLYSATKKIINPNLSDAQKKIMFSQPNKAPYIVLASFKTTLEY